MARLTKAEQEAHRQEMQALQEAHDFAAYPSRLMKALEEATQKNNFELTVRNSVFVLVDRDRPRDTPFSLLMTHTQTSQWALEALERTLEEMAEARAEAERKRTVRATALAKLTQEERELLDL
jgi:phage major head subunit gpT-like protein